VTPAAEPRLLEPARRRSVSIIVASLATLFLSCSAPPERIVNAGDTYPQPSAGLFRPSESHPAPWCSAANVPDTPPPPRTGLVAAMGSDGRIYAFGGDDPSSLVYDLSRHCWSEAAPWMSARSGAAIATGPDQRIYLVGGRDFDLGGAIASDTSQGEAYTPSIDRWADIPPMPSARSDPGLVVGGDGRLYALGGSILSSSVTVCLDDTASSPTLIVESYDPNSRAWSSLDAMPSSSDSVHAVAGGDGAIYALNDDSTDLTHVDVYYAERRVWTTGVPMPRARAEFAAVSGSDGRIYVIGGVSATSWSPDLGTPLVDVDVYSPESRTWTRAADAPGDRCDPATVASPDGKIYVIGGLGTGELDIIVYDIATDTWRHEP
jgi:hypothetical protein